MWVGESCFFPLVARSKKLDFENSKKACADNQGHLAYIDSLETFRAVESFLRDQMQSVYNDDYMYFWTGATYDGLVSFVLFAWSSRSSVV